MILLFRKNLNFPFIVFFIFSFLIPVLLESQNWLWAKNSIGGQEIESISSDLNGNVFITGYFQSHTLTFDSIVFINNTSSGIGENFFLAKYDANGNLLWAKTASGNDANSSGESVSSDANGNAFVTGYFISDTFTVGATTLTNTGNSDNCNVFIAKYDANGNVLWVKSSGSIEDHVCSVGYSVSSDIYGNVFIAGSTDADTITFNSYILTTMGSFDSFIVKYDADGNALWAKSAGGVSEEKGTSLSSDTKGNVFLKGYFASPSITFDQTTLINDGLNYKIFIVKYDADGNVIWAKSNEKMYDAYFENESISSYKDSSLFVLGYFSSPIMVFGSTTLNGDGGADAFIGKYDASGNELWAKGIGKAQDIANSIGLDENGDIFLTGKFYNPSITFDNIKLLQPVNFYNSSFIVKYNASGSVICASALLNGFGSGKNCVVPDHFGNAYFGSDFSISPFIVGADTFKLNDDNLFVAKYTCHCNLMASIEGDNTVCNRDSATLSINSNINTNYLWSTGETGRSISVRPMVTTTYTATVYDGACSPYIGIKTVTTCQSISNIFSPNGDGINDTFVIRIGNMKVVGCTIYNRWGEVIEVGSPPAGKAGWQAAVGNTITVWDGRNSSGVECPDGVYYYVVNAKDNNEKEYSLKGNVSLIR